MGIRIFDHVDSMLAQGFHSVEIPLVISYMDDNWINYRNRIDDWCQQYIRGEYNIATHWHPTATRMVRAGFFRSDADAMVFILKWAV